MSPVAQTMSCAVNTLVLLMPHDHIPHPCAANVESVRSRSASAQLHPCRNELALTQGAISQHICTLEAQVGYALFARERAGAEPTAHPHALALQVRQGLRVLERAFCPPASSERRLDATPPAQAMRLTVSALPVFAARWLTPRLHRFEALHPEIALDIRPSPLLARLDGRDRVDVALRYGPGAWP